MVTQRGVAGEVVGPSPEGRYLKVKTCATGDLLLGELTDVALQCPVVGQDKDPNRFGVAEAVSPM